MLQLQQQRRDPADELQGLRVVRHSRHNVGDRLQVRGRMMLRGLILCPGEK